VNTIAFSFAFGCVVSVFPQNSNTKVLFAFSQWCGQSRGLTTNTWKIWQYLITDVWESLYLRYCKKHSN